MRRPSGIETVGLAFALALTGAACAGEGESGASAGAGAEIHVPGPVNFVTSEAICADGVRLEAAEGAVASDRTTWAKGYLRVMTVDIERVNKEAEGNLGVFWSLPDSGHTEFIPVAGRFSLSDAEGAQTFSLGVGDKAICAVPGFSDGALVPATEAPEPTPEAAADIPHY